MPELPEVEVTRRQIAPLVQGILITGVRTSLPTAFFDRSPRELVKALIGQSVVAVERQGKYLLLPLSGGRRLLLHLGMSGQIFGNAEFVPDRHTHLTLELGGKGAQLYFRDPRRFGRVILLEPGASHERLERLGPDALGLEGPLLHRALQSRSIPIKVALLDQSVTAGIGNIYADEALHRAGIVPTRAAREVSPARCTRLALAVREVLEAAIERGGSTISDFRHPDGSHGSFQSEHRVYGREGQPCGNCGSPILRLVLGQRSCCYCPRCQR